MTKQEWQLHSMTVGEHDRKTCPQCQARLKTKRANRAARERHQAYLDVGLVRVRGALGGVYYE